MMRRTFDRAQVALALVLAFALITAPTQAQLPTYRVTWEMPATTAADAMGFDYALSIDGASTLLTGVVCTQLAGGTTTCGAPLPAMSSGAHTLAIVASDAFGSSTSDTLSGSAPSKPGNVKVRR